MGMEWEKVEGGLWEEPCQFEVVTLFLALLGVLSPVHRGVPWLHGEMSQGILLWVYMGLLWMEKLRLTCWYGESTIIYKGLYIPGGAGFLPSIVGIQSYSQMMISMSNHLLSIVFRFHYHSQKVIGSLGWSITTWRIMPGIIWLITK